MHLGSLIVALSLSLLQACSPKPGSGDSRSSAQALSGETSMSANADPASEDTAKPQYKIRPKVDAFTLDDKKFSIVGVAAALQPFMDSETPVITYKLPDDADFVDIIRCPTDVVLTSSLGSISVVDVELSGRSEAERAAIYRSSDFFEAAKEQSGCEVIASGTSEAYFQDSFAPSGSFRYLVRPCVNPKRLINFEKLTKRECSRRVAVSSALLDYTSKRREKELEHLRLASSFSSQMDQAANTMRVFAEDANDAIVECEEREHRRLVDVKIREAWITLAAIILEVTLEFKTATVSQKGGTNLLKGYAKHYTNPRNFMDIAGLLGSLQGFMLADTFKMLAKSSEDFPRSCARYLKLINEYQILETQLAQHTDKYFFHTYQAELARTGQLAVEGLGSGAAGGDPLAPPASGSTGQ